MNKVFVQQYVLLEKKHWWFVVRQKIIRRFLQRYLNGKQENKLHILNIGAAGGATSTFLSAFGEVTSVESDDFFIQYLVENNFNVTKASVTELPFSQNTFDLVCAFDVLEHVENDALAINEMTRVCKENGYVCITVPAFQMLWSNHDVVNHHYRRYTKSGFANLVNHAPLKIIKCSYFNSLLFLPILMVRKLSALTGRKNPGKSDFEMYKTPAIVDFLLKSIFSVETVLVPPVQFPFGVSLLALMKKNKGKI
ncbi:MAG: class I SAM-dependent methyltransferase [Bacteroidetes bacterium]|nr:class I SAM-dependent methyltransferase [Bacteroidota bacterium]